MDDGVEIVHLTHFILSQLGHILATVVFIKLEVIVRDILFDFLSLLCFFAQNHLLLYLFTIIIRIYFLLQFFLLSKHFFWRSKEDVTLHMLFSKL